MFYALDENGERVSIRYSLSKNKYYCPCCNSEVIQKKGEINVWHYAHKNLKECDSWYEMSEWHKNHQEKFPSKFREIVINDSKEIHRADIKIDNLIIEFQHSPISRTEFINRTNFYSKHGYLIWLFDLRDAYNIECIGKRKFKWKWCRSFLLESVNTLKNVEIFFELSDYSVIKVEWNYHGLKYFGGKKYTVDSFQKYINVRYRQLQTV